MSVFGPIINTVVWPYLDYAMHACLPNLKTAIRWSESAIDSVAHKGFTLTKEDYGGWVCIS